MSDSTLTLGRRLILIAALILGAVKVFAFNLAMPPFNNSDEHQHADLVDRYSRGIWPHEPRPLMDPVFLRRMIPYESPEYLYSRASMPGLDVNRPLHQMPGALRDRVLAIRFDRWSKAVNHETHSPPVYYALAGLWTAALRPIWPFSDARSLYIPRLLNVPLYVLFLLALHRLARLTAPHRPDWATAAVVLAVMMPVQVFYGINSDVLLPPLFAWAMVALLIFHRAASCSAVLAAIAGLLTAAAFLTKYTAVPIAILLGLVLLSKLRSQRRSWSGILIAAACAAIPVLLVFARNQHFLGDWTGAAYKMEALGWKARSLQGWLSIHEHPIWQPWGHWYFLRQFMSCLWIGELHWGGQPLTFNWLTGLLILAPLPLWLLAALPADAAHRLKDAWMLWIALLCSLLTLVWLSLAIDYTHSLQPVPSMPFLPNARMVSGCLAAAMILLVNGLGRLLTTIKSGVSPMRVLLAVGPVMIGAELALMYPVILSQWNFFHVP